MSALADLRVVAVGQFRDELVGVGAAGHPLDLPPRRVRGTVGDVLGDRSGEEGGVLEDDARLATQACERDVADVRALDADGPGVGGVEPGVVPGRLAGARGFHCLGRVAP